MFTGIIKSPGFLIDVKDRDQGKELAIRCPGIEREIKEGESVSVNGVCLTVEAVRQNILSFHAVRETLSRTTLGNLKKGDRVNIEPSLRVGDPLGGHFVLGHVEGTGKIATVEEAGDGKEIKIETEKNITKWIVPRGCVAVDGISLTPTSVNPGSFSVALVPETLERTTLGSVQEKDRVNIEVDLLSKYAAGRLDETESSEAFQADQRED